MECFEAFLAYINSNPETVGVSLFSSSLMRVGVSVLYALGSHPRSTHLRHRYDTRSLR